MLPDSLKMLPKIVWLVSGMHASEISFLVILIAWLQVNLLEIPGADAGREILCKPMLNKVSNQVRWKESIQALEINASQKYTFWSMR